jgi:Bacterial membrane protein YfhO
VFRFHLPSAISDFVRRHADLGVVLVLVVLTLVSDWDLFRRELTLGMDSATQYYPWYYFLGGSLRSGSIPGWNPYQFSGTPFAADPLTGWAYLLAMLLFALLPLTAAVKSLMFSHLLLAGLAAYALARMLGMGIPGALLAAIAYEFSGLFYVQNTCCLQYIGVMAWLPLAMVGAELAIRSVRWLERGVGWALSGLGLSQILASWFGQGSYYALLALGGYIAYRTLFSSETNEDVGGGIRRRVSRLLLHGGAALLFGFALGAAGVLPRLEYNALSNLAGGYPAEIRAQGGWSVGDWVLLLKPGLWYVGVTVAALALVAPLVGWRRFAVPYFFFLSLGSLILTAQGPTPLHSVLYLLPLFEQIHPHNPDRAIVLFYLGAALLSGAGLTMLGERVGRKPLLLVLPFLTVLVVATVSTLFPPIPEGQEGLYPLLGGWEDLYPLSLKDGVSIPLGSLLFLVLAAVLVAAYALIPARLASWRGLAFALLALVVFADLLTAGRVTINDQRDPTGGAVVIRETDPAEYYSPSGAGRFLQSRSQEEPFRYFGYDPGLGEWSHISSPARFAEPNTWVLEVNNQATLLGLQNIQGYDPTHIARYDEYMGELNGSGQGYHFLDVYEGGLDSPLLDLLNVRYVVVPAQPSQENPEGARRFERFESTHPTVYEDDKTKVLENQHALPRAWIVHSAEQVGSQKEALDLLSSGEVNPAETALLEEESPPQMSQPDDASAERADVTDYQANQIQIKTSTQAPGLLMLSEVYYPAWKAYIDGQPAPVHVGDQLLRSVEIPAGEHTVELRYESWALGAGVVISLVAYVVLVVLAVVAGYRHWRRKTISPNSAR